MKFMTVYKDRHNMVDRSRKPAHSARDFLPKRMTLSSLAAAVQHCRGCELYKNATQAVFGEGSAHAQVILLGEQPGDQEDLAGQPFVGPAGKLLDSVLEEVGLGRDGVYVTNAVKHFKWTPRGKRRLHAKPTAREISACRPWLEAEIAVIEPRLIVCLGATAAQTVLGASFRLTQHQGEILKSPWGPPVVATYHPSAVLRAPNHDAREELRRAFVDDLRRVVQYLKRA